MSEGGIDAIDDIDDGADIGRCADIKASVAWRSSSTSSEKRAFTSAALVGMAPVRATAFTAASAPVAVISMLSLMSHPIWASCA